MNLGWLSASPGARTGYGTQTAEIVDRLMEKHNVVCIAQVSDVIVWGGRQMIELPSGRKVEVLPLMGGKGVMDTINKYYTPEFDLDVIIGFMDAFGIEYLNDAVVPVIGWIPIDGNFTETWAHYVRKWHRVTTYSLFGYHELQKRLPASKIGYIPHGIPKEFQLLDKDTIRDEFAELYGVPKDTVLYVNVGANMGPRKELPLMIKTFGRLVEKVKATGGIPPHLFMHTNAYQVWPRGYDLITWRRMMNMEDYVHFPVYNPIVSPVSNAELAKVHTAADVYWQNSVAEGFGLPEYESLACGTPVVCPRNSSQVEIIEGRGPRRGWLVENVPGDMYEQIPVYIPQLPTYPVPDQNSALEALLEAYYSPDLRERYGKTGHEFIERYHRWDTVMHGWDKLLSEMESDLGMFTELQKAFS